MSVRYRSCTGRVAGETKEYVLYIEEYLYNSYTTNRRFKIRTLDTDTHTHTHTHIYIASLVFYLLSLSLSLSLPLGVCVRLLYYVFRLFGDRQFSDYFLFPMTTPHTRFL